ncbi:penicillin-binding protein activator [Acetobacteraceae bacterium]|nr:penicillin-binding protein activator [Acetobacteraceae bacterium]
MKKNEPLIKRIVISHISKKFCIVGSCLLLSGCFANKVHSPFDKSTHGNQEIALFLPLSGNHSAVALQLKDAAMLAFEDTNSTTPPPKVRVFDTSALSPQAAAESAIADKASVVLGPITAEETRAASEKLLLAGIPEISFTSDTREEKQNLWVSGLTARQQVSRLVSALKAEGKTDVAAFLPMNDFGKSFGEALSELCQENNLPAPQIVYHDGSAEQIAQNLQLLAKTQERHEAFEKAKETSDQALLAPPPFQALLLADTGVNLRNIIHYLPDSDIQPSNVQIMGPALWRAFDAKLAEIQGAWYAALDDRNRAEYVKKYEAKYHQTPLMITDIAYDLASVSKELQAGDALSAKTLQRPNGFQGIDGNFSFKENGRMERDLVLYQILPSGGAKIVDSNPTTNPVPTDNSERLP